MVKYAVDYVHVHMN